MLFSHLSSGLDTVLRSEFLGLSLEEKNILQVAWKQASCTEYSTKAFLKGTPSSEALDIGCSQ